MTYSITLVWLLAHVLAFSFSAGAATKVFPPLLSPNITQFAVQSLPNVSFPVPPSWAGQIPIPGTSDNQLFFWLFQAECQNASQNLISMDLYLLRPRYTS